MINFQSTAMSTPHRCRPPQLIPSEHARRPHVFRAGFETSQKALCGGGELRVPPEMEKGPVRRRRCTEPLDTLAALVNSGPLSVVVSPGWQQRLARQTVPAIHSAVDGDDGLPDRHRRQKAKEKTHHSNKMKRQRSPPASSLGTWRLRALMDRPFTQKD